MTVTHTCKAFIFTRDDSSGIPSVMQHAQNRVGNITYRARFKAKPSTLNRKPDDLVLYKDKIVKQMAKLCSPGMLSVIFSSKAEAAI